MAHAGGRPLKFKNVEEMQKKIDDYFNNTDIKQWTITGLAIELDMDRKKLIEYQERDEFSNAIKRAKRKVEYSYELDLRERGNAGTIFALKNFNWKDRQEADVNMVVSDIRVELNDE